MMRRIFLLALLAMLAANAPPVGAQTLPYPGNRAADSATVAKSSSTKAQIQDAAKRWLAWSSPHLQAYSTYLGALARRDTVRLTDTLYCAGGVCTRTAPTTAPTTTPTNPVPVPPAGGPAGFSFAAKEGASFTLQAQTRVAYGASGLFNYGLKSGTVLCSNEVFGDPILGTAKSCYVEGSYFPAAPAPVPPTSCNACAPLLTEDFEGYTSTAHMNSDPFGKLYEPLNPLSVGMQSLDMTGGVNGSKAARYDFTDRTGLTSTRCTDWGTSRHYRTGPQRAIWVEVYAKFSANWTVFAPASWGCTSGPDYKFIFGAVEGWQQPDGSTLWGRFHLDTSWQWTLAYPHGTCTTQPNNECEFGVHSQNTPGAPDPMALWDGQWHQYRLEWILSSAPGVADAGVRWWLDGRLILNKQGLISYRPYFVGLFLGANLNQGPAQLQSVWWDSIKVWNQNPGW